MAQGNQNRAGVVRGRFPKSGYFRVYCGSMQNEAQPANERQKIPFQRVIMLLIPAFFSLALVVLILVWEEYNPPGWQWAMEDYLAAYVASPRELLLPDRMTIAQLPFLLSPQTPFRPVTPSVHYQTEPLAPGVRPDSPDSLGGGKQPLPYPVMEVYCIDLSPSSATIPAKRYLVAKHQDLNNSDWIVYIPRKNVSPQAVDAAWNELRCEAE